MKQLTKTDMLQVNGGGTISYSDTCTGIWAVHKRRHSIEITGSGSTLTAAKKSFNSKLRTHKETLYQHTHSLSEVSV